MDFNSLDRPRGMLSADDREFLVGEKEYKHRQSKTKRKAKIKERLLNTMLDFKLVFENMDVDTIDEVLSFETEDEQAALYDGFTGAISTIYLASFGFHPPFSGLLKRGVYQGEQKLADPYEREVKVEFNVKSQQKYVTEKDVEHMIDRVGSFGLSSLSEQEQLRFLKYIYRHDSFDPEMAKAAFDTEQETYSERLEKGRRVSKDAKDSMYDQVKEQLNDDQDT